MLAKITRASCADVTNVPKPRVSGDEGLWTSLVQITFEKSPIYNVVSARDFCNVQNSLKVVIES